MSDDQRIQAILDFWFGTLDGRGLSEPGRHQLWFKYDAATDASIRASFGADIEAALARKLDHWKADLDGLSALVLLLDQFTRNVFRGTHRAFAGDELALALAEEVVTAGRQQELPTIRQVFLYVPYEHAENLLAQDRGVALFESLMKNGDPQAREEVAGYHRYAVAHRDVIARFGRFPHRNQILGRESTIEETAHLQSHGGF